MIYAKDHLRPPGNKTSFEKKYEFQLPKGLSAQKLTLNVRSEESGEGILLQGPVIVQTTESLEYVFEENDPFTEQFLELGFWSKSFATNITAWRIRAYGELPGLVDFVAYG